MQYLVRSGGLLGFPEFVEELGQSPLKLIEAVGLPVGALHDPDLYLPYPLLAELFTLAARRCREPDFGVRLGSRQGLEVAGALGSWMCLQDRVGDAMSLFQKNLGFHARGLRIDVDADRRHVVLEIRLAFSDETDCDQLLALATAVVARGTAQMHGTGLNPEEVALALPAPRDDRAWRSAFSRKPRFEAPLTRIVYPSALLQLPVRVEPAVRARLSTQWRGTWQQRLPVGLRQQVERAIVALLPTGECDLERVAQIVNVHPRSLQRRLGRESSGFGQVLREMREKLAREHLAHGSIDLTSLAMNLGFGELAVFSRAFKSWTGLSPREWRRQGANDNR